MNAPTTKNSGLNHSRLPELLVAGFIFAGGAWVWTQHLAPVPDRDPEIAATNPRPAFVATEWKTPSNAERTAAQKVIVAQLEAFKTNRWPEAISYQSSNLKRNFASPQQFRTMMTTTYPQFVNYKTVKFGPARMMGPHLQVVTSLIGKDGKKVTAVYMMLKEKGKYYVDGVGGGMTSPPMPRDTQSPPATMV